jgi:hypothetical protein
MGLGYAYYWMTTARRMQPVTCASRSGAAVSSHRVSGRPSRLSLW